MAWANFDPKPYTRDEYAAHVAALPHLPWVRFIVLHNTGSPSLAQWIDGGVDEHQRLINLENYYEHTEGWHAGPNGFISPTHICGFSDPTKPGVHASCFNSVSLGFEMVGDYSVESFDTGPGEAVRDNTVYALALWHRKLNLRPDNYRYGVRGLHLHKDCMRDHHNCPGAHVDRADMVARILAEMQRQSGGTPAPAPAPAPTPAEPAVSTILDAQDALNRLGAFPKLSVDGIMGPKTQSAIRIFQHMNQLDADGVVGPLTWAAIAKALDKLGRAPIAALRS